MKGFQNHGNTCYFNTAIQCLMHIPSLTNYFLKNPYKGECAFTRAYSDLVKVYWTKGHESVTISSLLEHFRVSFPRFRVNEQHDIQEAVLCIIDILETAIPEIKQWLYGKKIQETIWPGGKSSNEEDFSIHLITSHGKDMRQMLAKSTDWNVIENFEDTGGKVHHLATTRMLFSKLPKVLMISFDTKSHIQIIENIRINESEYNLIASAVHLGHQHDGHYVSMIKRKNKWFLIDDDSINECELPGETGYYFMVYNLKTPSSECSP
jgi:ubiquitin C-terminal hydrolase